MKQKIPLLLFLLVALISGSAQCPGREKDQGENRIFVWYGKTQTFGAIGNPQRCINILGSILTSDSISDAWYSLNSSGKIPLSTGKNDTRLARDGDFNVEIDRELLLRGNNKLELDTVTSSGKTIKEEIIINYIPGNQWPLPYEVNWENVDNISDVVQVIDGKWKLSQNGIRTVEPYYDRVIALGDSTWKNVEATTSVIFHAFTPPAPGPPAYNVSHAAIALRWPGHEEDGNQPNIQWYPLGATCEFKLNEKLDNCHYRIIGDRTLFNENAEKFHKIELGKKYFMKAQVTSDEENSRYRAKLWDSDADEPVNWDIESIEGSSDIKNGSVLLIAHNTDVTFGNIKVVKK